MFYSQCLLSRKGPLGAIWVAAYCFKRLKKAQVKETDISSSVDKIQDEINDYTYRVLAYLLLGVVRIYSKKVEYLFHDCNDVLVKIKKFMINTKNKAHMETLCTSITLPDRFELDAFDLDVLEDVGGENIAPQEEITLKDILWKNERIGQFSLDKYHCEEFDCCQNTTSADDPMVEEPSSFHQLHLMDINFEVCAPNSPANLQTENEKVQDSAFSPNEQMKFDTDFVVEGVSTEPVNLFTQDKQTNEEQMTEGAPCEDEVQGERSIEMMQSCRISQEESVDIKMFCQGEEELVVPIEPLNESHQIDEEQIKAKETAMAENQMQVEIGEVYEARNLQASMEWLQDDPSYQEECIIGKDKLKENIDGSIEENHNKGKSELQENVSIEDGKFHVIPPMSLNIDVTPVSRFQDALAARPKPGATTPELMLIPTPAARERARFSRKRKFVWDDMIVLPNMVLRQSINNARDLISKRRKCPHTLLAAWRASCISSLPKGFHESLLPCHSLELQSLFSRKKTKISESLETLETQGKLDESESQAAGRPDHMATAPKTPPQLSTIQSVESPDTIRLLSPRESMEREQSLKKDEEHNLMKECNVGTLSSYECIEREQCLRKDEELNLMNEEINPSETENSKSCGWSGQTRKAAMYLHRNFLNLRKQREEEVVNFSQVLGVKTRKECARLFYEILVLKTTSFVDVKQDSAYGDTSVRKLPKMDQILELMAYENTDNCQR